MFVDLSAGPGRTEIHVLAREECGGVCVGPLGPPDRRCSLPGGLRREPESELQVGERRASGHHALDPLRRGPEVDVALEQSLQAPEAVTV